MLGIGIGLAFPRRRAGGASPVLDLIGTSALAAYSLRLIRAAYAGSAIRVRRSSDNAEQDIGFAGGGLNTASLLAFVGAGDGFVTTWYDQTGNARHLTQATAANQPAIVLAGVYLGEARIQGGSIQTLACTDAAFNLIASAATFSTVLGTTSVGGSTFGGIWSVGTAISARLLFGVSSTVRDLALRPGGTNLVASPVQTLPASGAVITLTKTAVANASACSSRLNGSAASSYTAEAITAGATDFNVGRAVAGNNGEHGHREMIIWNSVLSAGDLQTLERNQGAAWGVTVA